MPGGFLGGHGRGRERPGGYFGKNLDALHDCLRGGFGTPQDGDFIVEWHHHEHSKKALGYPETVRQLELTLERCHPSNRSRIRRRLEAARKGKGETVFDWLTGIFAGQIPGRLHLR